MASPISQGVVARRAVRVWAGAASKLLHGNILVEFTAGFWTAMGQFPPSRQGARYGESNTV